jgi:hypothetical protein
MTLGTPLVSYRSWSSAYSDGAVPYGIVDETTGDWEIGMGTLTGATLTRTTVLSSSQGNLPVSWGVGNKTVYSPMPADHMSFDMGTFVWPFVAVLAGAVGAFGPWLV